MMQQQIDIRRMDAADVDAVVGVYAEVLDPSYISFSELGEGKASAFSKLSPNAPAIFRGQLVALLDSPQHGFFVATVKGEVVGFALASVSKAEAGHTECWLDDLGVSRLWRGQGLAKKLVTEVFNWGEKENAAYYLLESGVRNESAHDLFESLGFQPLATVFWREGGNEAIAGSFNIFPAIYVRDEMELRAVSELDEKFYGTESIDHEGLYAWWKAYPQGVYVLRKEDKIIGAIGIWPIKKSTYNKLIEGKLDEVDITAQDIDRGVAGRPLAYWYFADIVLEKEYHDTPEKLALVLIEKTIRQWLGRGNLDSQVHACALGFKKAGVNILKGFRFQHAGGETVRAPNGKPVYTRSLTTDEIRQELDYLKADLESNAVAETPLPTPAGEHNFDVFISYRRQAIPSYFARLIQCKLEARSLNVFMDVDDLRPGRFDTALRGNIGNTTHFIVILSPGCFDKRSEKANWFQREIAHALETKRNIIPIEMEGFKFPNIKTLPANIRILKNYQSIDYSHKHFDKVIEKIIEYIQHPK